MTSVEIKSADDAIAIFRRQLADRLGEKLAASFHVFAGPSSSDGPLKREQRFVIGVMSGPGEYGHPIADDGPRPDCVLTNYPLPVDVIINRLADDKNGIHYRAVIDAVLARGGFR